MSDIQDLQEHLDRLFKLQKQFPMCNNIPKEIDRVTEKIEELKSREEDLL